MYPIAYIDPGSGAILLQCVIAVVATAAVFFRRCFVSPLAWIRGRHPVSEEGESGNDTE